jgi:hypothetical protein
VLPASEVLNEIFSARRGCWLFWGSGADIGTTLSKGEELGKVEVEGEMGPASIS